MGLLNKTNKILFKNFSDMKIIFLSKNKKLDKDSKIIVNTIKKSGISVVVLSEKDLSEKKYVKIISSADFFVVQLESSNFGLGYQIANLSQKRKFVLCFYPESMRQKLNPENFVGTKYTKYLKFVCYNKSNLSELVKKNLRYPKETMMRRFNFFVSKDIDDYLDWVSYEEKKERAEFLRSLIQDALSKDRAYGAYLKRKKPQKNIHKPA